MHDEKLTAARVGWRVRIMKHLEKNLDAHNCWKLLDEVSPAALQSSASSHNISLATRKATAVCVFALRDVQQDARPQIICLWVERRSMLGLCWCFQLGEHG